MIREKSQAGAIRVACLFPFVTSIRLGGITSTITGRNNDDLSALALNLVRHSFFVDCDIRGLLDYAEKVLPPPTIDLHYRFLNRVSGYMVTPEFHEF
jgi:hypothetical protein